MDHKQAIEFSIKSITERIEILGAEARAAHEDGNDERNSAARNFQNGLIECCDLLEHMMLLVEITDARPTLA